MKILVACEFSGIVREAFRRLGHDAWSCDLLATEIPGQHIQDDVLNHLGGGYDMMIAHPPCTHLCLSGVRWLYGGKGKVRDQARWTQMLYASVFFKTLLDAPIERVCIENPLPHGHARLPKYSQIIQPWQFGHGEIKATCLWLRGLPLLKPTDIVEGRKPRVHLTSPGPSRWKERSRTFSGIAEAMAKQWGSLERRLPTLL